MYIFRRLIVIGFVLFVNLFTISSHAARVQIPEGVFYYQPAASVFGSEAVWCNPSVLGWYDAVEYQLMTEYYNSSFGKSWGSVVNRKGISVAYRHLYNPEEKDCNEYVFGSGIPLGRSLAVGLSYRYFKDGSTGYNKRHYWNLSTSGKTGGSFSWAAVFSNLNRGRLNGEQTETEQRYSLAYRPIKDKLTLAVDASLSTGQNIKEAVYQYHAEFIPIPGVFVEGYIDSDRNFQVGLRVNLLKHFTGWHGSFSKDGNHSRSTVYMGATSKRQASVIPERKRRLSMNVSGRPEENPPQPFLGHKKTPFWTTLLSVYRAADDDSIRELVIELNGLSLGFGQAQELRDALSYFRQQGKYVVCHLSAPNNIGYYVASVSDEIYIPPVSQLNLVGLRAELTYYTGTMEKIGVKADMMRIGKYKKAAEAFTRKSASKEGREATNKLLDNLYSQFVGGIAEGRSLSQDSVKALIDKGPFTSEKALSFGLVDGLSYRDNLNDGILRSMPEINFRHYQSDTLLNDGWPHVPVLAVVVADGNVVGNNGSGNPFGGSQQMTPASMSSALENAGRESDVKGIIWRVNSPGGVAMAGERIYHSVDKISQHKSLVVSMANVAASAGYYVSMPGKYIFADPGTITGSIGIFGGKVNLSGLYDKIDLGKELYTRGKFAGMLSTIQPFTDNERDKYYSQLKAFYDHFVGLVAESRNLSVDSVDAISRGRVWTGQEALDIGLVDELGGLRQAIGYSARSLGLDDYRIKVLPQQRPWFLLPDISLTQTISRLFGGKSDPAEVMSDMFSPLMEGTIIARMPYDIEIE